MAGNESTVLAKNNIGLVYIPEFTSKFYYAKRRFPITSKCRHIYGVLNVDEIKN
jgi:hypothetical protein